MSTDAPAVEANELSKTFRIPRHTPMTLKERALHPLRRPEAREYQALRGVSFDVAEGEFFGVVGRNGSGKSTLLKLLAGIYKPDAGTARVRGLVSPFIELGVGFNMEMNARDNVIINATLLGLSRAEAQRRFDEVIEFAELQDFTDLKLKNYSSGMQVRLGFATAIQVDADVLLLDEVLAVGDAQFQEKCFDVFRSLKQQGKTIVLVTHDLSSVERFCDRVALLETGRLDSMGEPAEVIHRYQELTNPEGSAFAGERGRWGDGAAEIADAWIEDSDGTRIEDVEQGEPLRIRFDVEFRRPVESPVFGITMRDEELRNVFVTNTLWAEGATRDFSAGERVRVAIDAENHFSVGRWFVSPAIAHQDVTRMIDWRDNWLTFQVRGRRWTGGTYDPAHEIRVETAA